jgi:hypothetical protein|tara:strand:+ start:326 stop:556 length:231 start_codon:yes stop_codon:yes gene_type:complete
MASDYDELCELMGFSPGDPEACDAILASFGKNKDNKYVFNPEGNIDLEDIISVTQCDDPSECADCDGEECQWECPD